MPSKSAKTAFPTMLRVSQLNSSFCGPAVLQMLLSYLGTEVSQNILVDAANINERIKIHGATITDLANSVKILFPQYQFWYKFNSTLADLSMIINTYKYPVGVEWQGVFDWPDDEDDEDDEYYENDDDDAGHYSIVTAIDTNTNLVLIADPEKHYAGTDRRFTILSFEHRWWDINEVVDAQTGHKQEVDDNHAMFIITPTYVTFPDQLHMVRA